MKKFHLSTVQGGVFTIVDYGFHLNPTFSVHPVSLKYKRDFGVSILLLVTPRTKKGTYRIKKSYVCVSVLVVRPKNSRPKKGYSGIFLSFCLFGLLEMAKKETTVVKTTELSTVK